MPGVMADTHAAVYYLLAQDRLSSNARAALEGAVAAGHPVYLSAISLVELVYLIEKRRLPHRALDRLIHSIEDPDGAFEVVALDAPIAKVLSQVPREDVPDMPDRIIAATAVHMNLPLVTRDHRIKASATQTVW